MNRAKELVPGGVMMIVISCVDETGSSPLHYTFQQMFEVLKEFVTNKSITNEELLNFTIGSYLRSFDELLNSKLFDMTGLELIFHEFKRPPNPHYDAFKQNHDDDQFAEAWTRYIQARTEPALDAALVGCEHPRQMLINYYARLRELIKQDPHKELYNGADRMLLVLRKKNVDVDMTPVISIANGTNPTQPNHQPHK